jgi:TetR/AcrR family transcriptional regulator
MENDSKEKLLQTAIELFADDGFDKTSIRQLAAKANVNSALISYHFGSKQGLYQAAVEKQLQILVDFTQKAQNGENSPIDILELYASTMLKIHTENPYFIKLCYREFIAPSAILEAFAQNHLKYVFEIIAKALHRGIEEGLFRQDLDVDAAVILWAGMVNFFFFSRPIRSRIKDEKSLPATTYLTQTLDIFLSGIKRRD